MKSRLFLILGLALLAAGPAMTVRAWAAPPEAGPGDKVEEPDWLTKPDGAETLKYYPDIVSDRSISGSVVLNCLISDRGKVESCEIERESPYGLGFGDASIKLLKAKGWFKPRKINGKAVESEVKVPFSIESPTIGAEYVIFQPLFTRTPSFEDMLKAWPDGSDLPEQVVVLRCSLRSSGSVSKCISAGQAPGPFLDAARSLKGKFEARLTDKERQMYADADILISLRFVNPASVEGRSLAVKDPHWVTTLNADKVLAVYPQKAAEAGIRSGRGVADCLVAADGKLTDCKVAREKPSDMGFGASAVAIAQLMQMNPWTLKGRPVVGGRVRLPIDFNLADEPVQ
ncbi:MAG: TonB family protein [Caulobacter sp.]|nr:TonB family protein [Caulobacter sp.]